jgi:hypothetical protein
MRFGSTAPDGRCPEAYPVAKFESAVDKPYTGCMDIVPIPMTQEEFNAVLSALNSTEVRYQELSKEQPHLRERAEAMRRVYDKLVPFMDAYRSIEPPPI